MSLPPAGTGPTLTRDTLPSRLALFAASRPGEVALREKKLGIWIEYTWADYLRSTAEVARALWCAGVRAEEGVAILSENCPEWLYTDLAAQGIGARSVGIYQTNPASEVAFVLGHAGCRIIICEDQEQVDKVWDIAEETPLVERVVVLDPRGTRGYEDPRLQTWDEFLGEARQDVDPVPWFLDKIATRDPSAASMVVYTSGTTAQPKGAMLSARNVTRIADESAELLGVTGDDTMLSYLPLCHVGEKIFSIFLPLSVGCVVHFGESIDTVQADLREVSPTVFLGVPRIWEKMHASVTIRMQNSTPLKRGLFRFGMWVGRRMGARWEAEGGSLRASGFSGRALYSLADWVLFRPLQERLGVRRCRIPVSGAAPIGPQLLRWFHSIGVPVLEGFGQTECAGVSHLNPPRRPRVGSVGTTLPGLECKVASDGEILLRGDPVFVGYLHDVETTSATIDTQGWLHTGDVGALDEDGYLFITGRKKEILITAGGKNLSPERIENALKGSPFIKEAVAIGDRRKYVAALIQIDYAGVGDWASRAGIPYTSYEDLAAKVEVVQLVEEEIERANTDLARVEQVRRFRMLPRELNRDEGELTATQKVRRRAVLEVFDDLVRDMYGGEA